LETALISVTSCNTVFTKKNPKRNVMSKSINKE
jgi:hypothetical protein